MCFLAWSDKNRPMAEPLAGSDPQLLVLRGGTSFRYSPIKWPGIQAASVNQNAGVHGSYLHSQYISTLDQKSYHFPPPQYSLPAVLNHAPRPPPNTVFSPAQHSL